MKPKSREDENDYIRNHTTVSYQVILETFAPFRKHINSNKLNKGSGALNTFTTVHICIFESIFESKRAKERRMLLLNGKWKHDNIKRKRPKSESNDGLQTLLKLSKTRNS